MLGTLSILIGSGLLLAGRKLFWLLVGGLGFLLGLEIASRIVFRSPWMMVVAALVLGALFALLAVLAETAAIGIAGFLGGGLAFMRLLELVGIDSPVARTVAFIVGAIAGAVLVVRIFSWALIIISSVAGASMVASGIVLTNLQRSLVFLGLLAVGILVQAYSMYREQAAPNPDDSRTR